MRDFLTNLLYEGISNKSSCVRKEGYDNQVHVTKYSCDLLCAIKEGYAAYGSYRDSNTCKRIKCSIHALCLFVFKMTYQVDSLEHQVLSSTRTRNFL